MVSKKDYDSENESMIDAKDGFICSTEVGLADLVQIGVEISVLNRFTNLN